MDHGKKGGYVTTSGQVNSWENATEEGRAKQSHRVGIHEGGPLLGSLADLIKDEFLNADGKVDWVKVGAKAGLNAEEVQMLKDRESGATKRSPGNQALWKKLQRKYSTILGVIYDEERASELGQD